MKHTFHRENCESRIRKSTKKGNLSIVLSGTHAFEWKVSICLFTYGGIHITTETYPNRIKATSAYNKRKRDLKL